MPCLTSSADAQRLLTGLAREPQECVVAIFLAASHRVLGVREVFRGTIESSVARPREILRAALAANAARLIVAHNHPSGDPDPSEEDMRFTARLEWAADVIGIPLLDHLIVCESGDYFSFADAKLIKRQPDEPSRTPAIR